MKKRLASVLLCAALLLPSLPTAQAAFTDISDQDTALAAAALQGMGIVTGTTPDTFNPNGTLTRAEICTMIVNAMGLSDQVAGHSRKTLFSDVPSSAWFNGYVNLAYSKGVINGYGNGTFGPGDPITYGQLATILLRMLGYTTADIGPVWPMDFTNFFDDLGLSGSLSLSPNQKLTRGQAAILIYNALKEPSKSSSQPYYRSISGISSVEEAILLDASAAYGGSTDPLMVYSLSSGEVSYYEQSRPQSSALEGTLGSLLFNSSGEAAGFIPASDRTEDVTIGSATASTLTAANGTAYRISSGASVISGGDIQTYRTGGYLQLDAQAGKNVRLYYDDSGAITHLYLTGGTSVTAQAAVASTTSAASSLARELGISGRSYSITKNGASADAEALSRYDVGYYDGASNTLRVSDWKVTGTLTAASPSVTAASTVTVAGHTFDVLECAWDTLKNFRLSSSVTLLLTDDCKVAAVYSPSTVKGDMLGVLAENGKSVTLVDSGITLSASTMEYRDASLGGLVTVSSSGSSKLVCTAVTAASGVLDMDDRTLGGKALAPNCAIYEWAGSGYVYDLEGNKGSASYDLSAVSKTGTLASSYVSYYHTNSAGQVDAILLKGITGNCYQFGKLTRYSDTQGINLGSGSMAAWNDAATLTNSSGTSSRYLCPLSNSGSYVGIALGGGTSGHTQVISMLQLKKLSGMDAADFFYQDGLWHVAVDGQEYPVAEDVEIHVPDVGTWMEGEDGLLTLLADGYRLILYADQLTGTVRVIEADIK